VWWGDLTGRREGAVRCVFEMKVAPESNDDGSIMALISHFTVSVGPLFIGPAALAF